MAGLVPCPLTLFVMTFAISRGIPGSGIAFAATMILGVSLILSVTAAATILFRQRVVQLIEGRPALLNRLTRATEGGAGLVLTMIAVRELIWR